MTHAVAEGLFDSHRDAPISELSIEPNVGVQILARSWQLSDAVSETPTEAVPCV